NHQTATPFPYTTPFRSQLTHPNGTSLTFDVTGRTPTISAGALTQGQAEQGGAALLTWLPAGEFQIAAVPGSAEGKIVIDRALWRSEEHTSELQSRYQLV